MMESGSSSATLPQGGAAQPRAEIVGLQTWIARFSASMRSTTQ
jgi:hypothetical protein